MLVRKIILVRNVILLRTKRKSTQRADTVVRKAGNVSTDTSQQVPDSTFPSKSASEKTST